MTYRYTMCGLDYVYLLNGYRVHDTRYGRGVAIENADTLDRVIAVRVLLSHSRLRGQEVRFLRSLTHQSQAELATNLGLKRLTVARWEGAINTPIPGPADRALRVLCGHELFSDKLNDLLLPLFPEITDTHPEDIVMVYMPDETEPSLFPDDRPEREGWRPTKVA
jgi:DNA-binding transcriptional regulator YiaG